MIFPVLFLNLLVPLSVCISPTKSQDVTTTQWPLHNNGLNTVIQWDHYSFEVNGQRLFVFAGEFQYWRYPVPELWQNLLLKIKAAGFNAFSLYSHWGYHNPSPEVLDFSTGAHNFTSISTYAKDIGLYVLFRPRPYVNAEANAGGFPLLLTTGAYGTLRNNDTRYTAAWEPYFSKLSQIASGHLITKGGNVIVYQVRPSYPAECCELGWYIETDWEWVRSSMVRIAFQENTKPPGNPIHKPAQVLCKAQWHRCAIDS